ncbi:MAG TPA: ribonuclease HII [Cyclobacteriaceae bacterium]
MLKIRFKDEGIEAGCDEVGRGCLAGPVVAAAVILPPDFSNNKLNDSKLLSESKRLQLAEVIIKESICWCVAEASCEEIDEINILNASYLAMHRAIDQLSEAPNRLLIDGNRFNPYNGMEHHCIIKGDSKYMSIAAASILAKTFRDDYMRMLSRCFPEYSWHTNVGYPTPMHRIAIKKHGSSPHHRKSFQLIPNQLEIFDKL